MAQVWKCTVCGGTTQNPVVAGDHERKTGHYVEDIGE